MSEPRETIGNEFTVVDITGAMTDLPGNTVAVRFRVTTAGTLRYKGKAVDSAVVEQEFDTGTYRLPGRYSQFGPGATATIAVLDPADEIIAESDASRA